MSKLIKFVGNRAGEIFQSLDIKFAFVHQNEDDSYSQVHLAIKCRDFLGDCIWSRVTGNKVSIYGFYYDYQTAPSDDDKLKLSLTFPDEEALTNFKTNIDTYMANKKIDISWEETDDPLSLLVFADKIWQSAQWKLSLLTYYLKVASYKNESSLKSPECDYAEVLTQVKEKLLLAKVNEDIHFEHSNINEAHNYSGFVSVCKGSNKELYMKIFEGQV